ncbi:hypothetical protein QUB36_07155 [Microcoleus sp. AT8-B1]
MNGQDASSTRNSLFVERASCPFLRMVQELRYNDRQHGNSGYGNAQSVST